MTTAPDGVRRLNVNVVHPRTGDLIAIASIAWLDEWGDPPASLPLREAQANAIDGLTGGRAGDYTLGPPIR